MLRALKAPKPGELTPTYHKQALLGWIEVAEDGRCDAITVRGEALGRFNTERAAFTALLQAKAL